MRKKLFQTAISVIAVVMFIPLEKIHPVRNSFLTGQADFNRRVLPSEADGGFPPKADQPQAEKPPSAPLENLFLTGSAQTVRELRSLTGFIWIQSK